MSQSDVDIVLDQFAATNDRDFERAMTFYAEDVELEVMEIGGISENVHFGLPAELKGSTANGRSTQTEP
jgi:hypothetical protein